MITSANKKSNNRLVALKKKHKLLNNTIDYLSRSSTGIWEDSKLKQMKTEKLKIKDNDGRNLMHMASLRNFKSIYLEEDVKKRQFRVIKG